MASVSSTSELDDLHARLCVMVQTTDKDTGLTHWKPSVRSPRMLNKASEFQHHVEELHSYDLQTRPVWNGSLLPTVPKIPRIPLVGADSPCQREIRHSIAAEAQVQVSSPHSARVVRNSAEKSQSPEKVQPHQPATARLSASGQLPVSHASTGCGNPNCAECKLVNQSLSEFETRLSSRYALVSGLSTEATGVGGLGSKGSPPNQYLGSPFSNSSKFPSFRKKAATLGLAKLAISAAEAGGGGGAGERSPLSPRGKSIAGGGNGSPISHIPIRPPIYGLLCGTPLHVIREAFDELAAKKRNLLVVGMSVKDFGDLLAAVVPHLPLSESYVERMFDGFETTVNNATKRLSFFQFFPAYGEMALGEKFDKNVRIFFNSFETTEPNQIPLTALEKDTIMTFIASRELKGASKAAWIEAANAFSHDERVSNLHAAAAHKLSLIQLKKKREGRTKKQTVWTKRLVNIAGDRDLCAVFQDPILASLTTPTLLQKNQSFAKTLQNTSVFGSGEFSGSSSSGGGGSSAVEPCYCVSLQQLRTLIYGSSVLTAAFKESLWIPPTASELLSNLSTGQGLGTSQDLPGGSPQQARSRKLSSLTSSSPRSTRGKKLQSFSAEGDE